MSALQNNSNQLNDAELVLKPGEIADQECERRQAACLSRG